MVTKLAVKMFSMVRYVPLSDLRRSNLAQMKGVVI